MYTESKKTQSLINPVRLDLHIKQLKNIKQDIKKVSGKFSSQPENFKPYYIYSDEFLNGKTIYSYIYVSI